MPLHIYAQRQLRNQVSIFYCLFQYVESKIKEKLESSVFMFSFSSEKKASKKHFTKVYDAGWQRIVSLCEKDPNAARVWAFLVRHAGHDNVLVCSMAVMEDELGLCRRTLSSKVAYLERAGALMIAKMGTANAYVLNPHETWKTGEEFKNFHRLNARALIGKRENKRFPRRFTHM